MVHDLYGSMRKTLRSPEHELFLDLLIEARSRARLTQIDVAKRLNRPQSFVAKYENGERRIDIVEFVVLAKALEAEPLGLFKTYLKRMARSVRGSQFDRRGK